MEIVVTHNNMDFDSLAAQFGVTKLYPAARMVLGYPLTGNVRDFIALNRSNLPIVQAKYLDASKVSRVFIVDCQHAERLDETVRKLILPGAQMRPYTVFDHHEPDPDGLIANADHDTIIDPVGAATTLLVEQIKRRRFKLSQFEATLLLIGIYEDTGCLTYSGTTERDALCVAYLLKQGADLLRANQYMHPKLNDKQSELLQDLVKSSRSITIGGTRIAIATASRERYLDGLAALTRKLIEIESVAAAFSVAHMRDRIHIVGRSDTELVDVRPVVRHFGGDGHRGAGSAVAREGTVDSIGEEICRLLKEQVRPEKTAQEIMDSPVRTIRPHISMDEASRIMIRYGLDGLVVAEDDAVVGIVSRRDIDQATHHKLGHAPVLGFMSRPVISIGPTTTLSEIQKLMVHEDIGRLPVLDRDEKLVGLVSRKDVLKTIHHVAVEEVTEPIPRGKIKPTQTNIRDRLESLSPATLWLYKLIGASAERMNMVAYAVGGSVRDLLLGRPNFDLDFVIEGSAVDLAGALECQFPSRLHVVARHDRFQTATLNFFADEKREVDLSTARTEFYEYPAALPTVEPSKLEHDLLRRDFTINSLAICLNTHDFGMLMDHFGGLQDLKNKVVRILHPFSFIEDPTRIVRAARFASRLDFHLDAKTKEQARRAISMGIFDNLGGVRIRTELQYILESPHRVKALDLLGELGGKLRYLDAELEYSLKIRNMIRRAERLLSRYSVDVPWIVYLGLLLSQLPEERLTTVLDRLHLSNDNKDRIKYGIAIMERLNSFDRDLKRSEIYSLFHGKPDESLAIAGCLAPPGSPLRRMIRLYLDQLEHASIEISGGDLIGMGIPQGPQIGHALQAVFNARLDGLISTREEELAYVHRHFNDGN